MRVPSSAIHEEDARVIEAQYVGFVGEEGRLVGEYPSVGQRRYHAAAATSLAQRGSKTESERPKKRNRWENATA